MSRAFAAEGATLALADLAATTDLAREIGGRTAAFSVDVTQASAVRQMVAEVEAQLGRVDILVNVAGIVSFGSAKTLAEAEWDRVLAINLKGTFLCCQAVIPAMQARRWGRIINLGSVIGKNGGNPRPWIDPSEQARASNVAYGASKAGVACADVLPGAGTGCRWHHRERDRARTDRVRYDDGLSGGFAPADPRGTDGPGRGCGRRRGLPRLAIVRLHHRRDPGRQWGDVVGLDTR